MKNAVIKIKNLKVMATIGVYDFEQVKRQPLFITLKLNYNAEKACAADDISKAVDYSMLEKSVLEFAENSHFALIETLCDKILELVLQHPLVFKAEVRIAKPEAVNFSDCVFVSMKRNKNDR